MIMLMEPAPRPCQPQRQAPDHPDAADNLHDEPAPSPQFIVPLDEAKGVMWSGDGTIVMFRGGGIRRAVDEDVASLGVSLDGSY